MSSFLFPYTLPGIQYDYKRSYDFDTLVQTSASGKVSAASNRQYPLIKYEYSFEFLRDSQSSFLPSGSNPDITALVGLHNAVRGRLDTFLHTDPDFSSVTAQQFGTGDGTTQSFQLVAEYGNPGGPSVAEIIQNLNGTPVITLTDWEGTYTLSTSGQFANYLGNSNLFVGQWATAGVGSVSTSAVVSPDGTADASSYLTSGSGSGFAVSPSITASNGQTWTFSIWMKCASGTQAINIYLQNNLTTFTPTACTVTTAWQKFIVTATMTAGTTFVEAAIGGSLTGALTFSIFGPQVEPAASASHTVKTAPATAGSFLGYALGATGLISTQWTPWPNDVLKWSGSWYYRCRFDEDSYDWQKFMLGLWRGSKITFTTVKL